jgi:hypothetical protein
MKLDSSAYGRAWVCERFEAIKHYCKGRIELADDESLTDLQLADEIARAIWGSAKDSAYLESKYRRLTTPLRDLAKSKLLSPAERRTLSEAAAIATRLANAAELAKDRAKRKAKAEEGERERRYREALGLLGPPFAAVEENLEAAVIDMLALARYTRVGDLEHYTSIEEFDADVRNIRGESDDTLGAVLGTLAAQHQFQREGIAIEWCYRKEPIADLHARLVAALPALRAEIQAVPPILLQGVRRILAEAGADNVVRLRAPRPR